MDEMIALTAMLCICIQPNAFQFSLVQFFTLNFTNNDHTKSLYSLMHWECRFSNLKTQSIIQLFTSLLPRFVE